MIGDKARLDAYRRALKAVITPRSVVADIGAGTGIFALEACKLGARRVYAIDTADAIAVAAATAEANGFKDRLICIQADSRQIEPPEPVDVVVTELRGALPLFAGNVETMADAKQRWLKPNGVLIPQRDILRVTLVRSPRLYEDATRIWRKRADGLDLRPALRWALNQWLKSRVRPDELVGKTQTWAVVEYGEPGLPASRALRWTISNAATAHGWALWFDSELATGVRMNTGPGSRFDIYTHAFFPFERPLRLRAGDRVELRLDVHYAQEYLWTWTTRVTDRAGTIRVETRQSSFLAQLIGPTTLKKRSADYRAALNEPGRALMFALKAMSKGRTVAQAAQGLLERHQALFEGDFHRALAFAADASERHCL